ncbi:hypothetical protein [Lacipirellula sp.]|uniref:hypothetical protein n=1 Tax=Lacipirellula sp. TaxID=2691419 RepID=UPI003D0C6ACB
MSCLNLKRLWGDKYLVQYEENSDVRDPSYYMIPCQHGSIHPWGENELLAVYTGHVKHTKALLREFIVLSETKEKMKVIFPPGAFDEVAGLLLPERRASLVRRG